MLNDHCHRVSTHLQSINIIITIIIINIITLLYMFRVSSTHLQEDIVVHKQHMVPSLSIRVLVSCWYAAIGSIIFNNIWGINNIQGITLIVLYGQFMMHGQRNIKLSITYSVCACVCVLALGIQHAIRMRHIVICGLACCTIFLHIISSTARFSGKTKCMFFLYFFCPKYFALEE